MRRRAFLAAMTVAGGLRPSFSYGKPAFDMIETPSLADKVKAGGLPPVGQRIPAAPAIVKEFAGSDGLGHCGGQLNMLIANARDTRLMTLYCNARLIVYDWHFKLQPDILESYQDKDGREFTFKLRAGHKWSDGHPFTTEDFRYYWEDIANVKELTKHGPSVVLLVDGKPPKVEIIDELTIRYSWEKPNPYFIASQAQAAPLWLFRPSHYLKKFHAKYTPEAEILKSAKGGQETWNSIHKRLDTMYYDNNPDLPTLNPWMLTTAPPSTRLVYERNPYYYRVDEKGHQLPYVDSVVLTQVAANLVPAKAGLGESDLQCRYLNMRDYTFLRKSSQQSHVQVLLWEEGSGSQLALYPNLNTRDETWSAVNRDVRFRRALSLAIDRSEINQVIFLGLAKPSNNTIMPQSVLFKPEYAAKWANYDPALAGKLLNEAGLDKRNGEGIRLLPDGRPAIIVVEHQSDLSEDVDTLSLIADQWKKVGLKLIAKPQTLENFRLRVYAGNAVMTAYGGITTASPTPDISPKEFAPTMLGGLQWPRWGMFIESKERQGEACDMADACQLLDLLHQWETATNEAGRREVWEKMLTINMEQVFSIGTVNGVRQPVVVGEKVRNVPKKGYYAWDPGGYLGLYKPDTFWLAD
ncbi:MAG: peptide/nickel transport system substrate-binding protein [Rhodospirillaceae bacterium]|jgi:peptide/nickel transport system substrate-binding protein|nr:peptide/nickel transport system substrate-binding protein [Rhodospirillaceae bacterium]